VIIEILFSAGNGVDPLPEHVLELVGHHLLIARIGNEAGGWPGQSRLTIRLS